ncbi:uncharacterized protein TRIADDRAFT_51562 [Trichoplax adhaerens]|uniref:Protein kinase domain-containing protein n=1 Tax=Trichoplax adhaerens TaxID=10228 RepID=B3RJR8_TRIAD|nr:hypothetical protein TRIADDRAFT_51562 [Trichoplax adhaerens]EDV28547.1 hypothetical protein TRIADDRAFT_51562 [Trichoplax adhaerens]|eukprot:XP_002107749.1 hypothetical protein TRIADDRAFT_51562 [Trichoplax adhaerens]
MVKLTVNDLLECQNIIQYRHTNLVCLFSALMVDNHFCMVMEYVANGSLRSKLKAKDENLDYSVRLQICRGIAEGINYLHTAFMTYLVHRDIKSDNILLTEDYTPKICDFGLAKILSARIDHGNSAIFTETICGTEPYLPPESFQGIVSRRFDVYSYGVVLLEIISGKPATFSDLEGCRFLANYFLHCYNHDKSTFPIAETASWPNNIKKKLMKLAKNCLKRNYRDRPQMDKVTTKLAKINLMQDNSPDSKLTRFFSRI